MEDRTLLPFRIILPPLAFKLLAFAAATVTAVTFAAVAPARALTLAEGLGIVERTGREAALASAEELVQASAEAIAGAARLPSVDAYARGTLLAEQPAALFSDRTVPVAETDSLSYGVRVRQLLYDFGRSGAAVRAAGLDREAKRIEAQVARNRASLRFILAYSRLLRAERLLSLARDEVTRFAAQRDDAQALLDAGTAVENDLLQAEVRLADAVQRRLQAENGRALAAAQVNSQLQRPLDAAIDPEEIAQPPEPPPGLAEALAAAERDRVELRQLAARASAAGARREAVRTERFPQLVLAGGYDFTENRYQVHEGNWSLAAGVEMNLYAGGATRERLRQRERELLVLDRQRALLLDAVRLEVREASLALGTARARVGAAGAAVGQARENLRLQQLRYAEGVGTATEVLDAVGLLGSAEQNELNATCDATDALARLGFAAGRDLAAGWGGTGANPAGGGQP